MLLTLFYGILSFVGVEISALLAHDSVDYAGSIVTGLMDALYTV
jgi:hypothetical protein